MRETDISLLPSPAPSRSLPLITHSHHITKAAAREAWFGSFRQAEGGLAGHLEAGEGK
jgi:hypothetical protein